MRLEELISSRRSNSWLDQGSVLVTVVKFTTILISLLQTAGDFDKLLLLLVQSITLQHPLFELVSHLVVLLPDVLVSLS